MRLEAVPDGFIIKRLLGGKCESCKRRFLAEDAIKYKGDLYHLRCHQELMDDIAQAIKDGRYKLKIVDVQFGEGSWFRNDLQIIEL